MQIRLNVPYSAKERAKSLGARWDLLGKFWYVPYGVDVNQLREWWPESLLKDVLNMNERNHKRVKADRKNRSKSKFKGNKKPAVTGVMPKVDESNTLPWE